MTCILSLYCSPSEPHANRIDINSWTTINSKLQLSFLPHIMPSLPKPSCGRSLRRPKRKLRHAAVEKSLAGNQSASVASSHAASSVHSQLSRSGSKKKIRQSEVPKQRLNNEVYAMTERAVKWHEKKTERAARPGRHVRQTYATEKPGPKSKKVQAEQTIDVCTHIRIGQGIFVKHSLPISTRG